jgi:hypothetical protein
MSIQDSNSSYSGLVAKYIGTAYDTVKIVADNIASVILVADNIDEITAGNWILHESLNTIGGQSLGEITDISVDTVGLRFVFNIGDMGEGLIQLGVDTVYPAPAATLGTVTKVTSAATTAAKWSDSTNGGILLQVPNSEVEAMVGVVEIFKGVTDDYWYAQGSVTKTEDEISTTTGVIELPGVLTDVKVGNDAAGTIAVGSFCDVYTMSS